MSFWKTLSVSVLAWRLTLLVLGTALVSSAARAEIRLSSYNFSPTELPVILADQSDLNILQAQVPPGGYYKLRAKILVTYDPGYFHAIDTSNNHAHRLTHIPGPGNYVVQLYYVIYSASGSLTLGTFYSRPITITGGPATGSMGLMATYFDNPYLAGTPHVAPYTEAPGGAWASAGPTGVPVGADNFSVRWEGKLDTAVAGLYTFTTGSDDGMRVFLTDMTNQVAGSWQVQPHYTEASGQRQLAADSRYNIKVEFFESTGDATAKLFWTPPGGQKHIIPITRFVPPDVGAATPSAPQVLVHPGAADQTSGTTASFYVVASGNPRPSYQWRKDGQNIAGATSASLTLTNVQPAASGSYDCAVSNVHGAAVSAGATLVVNPTATAGTGTGLTASYYVGNNFEALYATRVDNNIDFDWGLGIPMPGVPADNFSVRWVGNFEAQDSGNHMFYADVDDGFRLYINGTLIINSWGAWAGGLTSQSIYLPAGVKVPIEVHFREFGGYANARLRWKLPQSNAEAVVPRERLYPVPLVEAAWQTGHFTESGTLDFVENTDTDEEGNENGNGTYDAPPVGHQFSIPSAGTIRIWTTGGADTNAYMAYPAGYTNVGAFLSTGGQGGNFYAELTAPVGTYNISVGGVHQGNSSDSYTLHVDFKPAAAPAPLGTQPTITSATTAVGSVGSPFTGYTIQATSTTTVVYAASNLPPGLMVNSSTGEITGTATVQGTYPNVIVSATNAAGSVNRVVSFAISPAAGAPTITSPTTLIAEVGTMYNYAIVGTNAPTQFTATGLPPGLSLNTQTGIISGIPTEAGTWTIVVTATNANGTANITLTITISIPIQLDIHRP